MNIQRPVRGEQRLIQNVKSTPSTFVTALSLLLLASGLFASSFAASSPAAGEKNTFPVHWGKPPLRQTRDIRQLPAEYGKGSGTLAKWIEEKMAQDSVVAVDAPKEGAPWPEMNLVGMIGEEGKRSVLDTDSSLDVQLVPQDAMVTMDYVENRVRIFVDDDGNIVRQPKRG